MKLTPIRIFLVIILLTILAAIVAAGGFLWNGKGEIRLFNRSFPYDFTLRRGLDLQGGLQLVWEGDNFVTTGLTGKDLAKADLQFDSTNGNPQIGLTFTAAGAKKFEEITARNIGQPLAIFLDGAVLSAPTVQGKISGGSAVITGTFTLEEARRFVAQLNAGALPTPISVLERRQIGPTLGEQELQKSVVAGLAGLVLVLLFMVGNYGRLGLLAAKPN